MDKTCGCSLGRREGKNFRRAVHILLSIDPLPPLPRSKHIQRTDGCFLAQSAAARMNISAFEDKTRAFLNISVQSITLMSL